MKGTDSKVKGKKNMFKDSRFENEINKRQASFS